MSTRRDFLNLTVKGSAMAAVTGLLPRAWSAQVDTGDSRSTSNMNNDTNSGSNAHYKPPFKFGLGGVPLGNEFAVVTDKDAYAILESAWSVLLPGFRGALSGHMSARMTRQYTHISTQAARRAVDLLNQP